jgi:hypothetical protein
MIMTTVLTDSGLQVAQLDAVLAASLGQDGDPGGKLVAEAMRHAHGRIELRDFLYCLARSPSSAIRKHLVDGLGKTPDGFVDGFESLLSSDDTGAAPPAELTRATVNPTVIEMFARAEARAHELGRKITDTVLTLALFEVADAGLQDALETWAGNDRLKNVRARLTAELPPRTEIALFGPDGRLLLGPFDASGKRLCRRMLEDAASLGLPKVTPRILLYTLLGNERSALAVALAIRGVDVKRDLHAALARELARAGKSRRSDIELTKDTVLGAVVQVLRHAHGMALEREAKTIAELDVARAFMAKQSTELARLFPPGSPLDTTAVREYLDASEPDAADDQDEREFTIAEIERRLRDRVVGQDAAVDRVLPWIKRLRFGLPRDGRPAGVFLFLGPTGTGKTQLAKELARYVYGDEEQLIFLEMGQFQSKESMSGFIGAPPGYVGYGEGKLTNGLRDKPEGVVLFDEIEKASTSVFDTLLRFADEGLISDPAGPVRDGRKCIIVLTTNAGQTWLRTHLKENPDAQEDPAALSKQLFDEAILDLRNRGYRPEFLGRVDECITFLPFTPEACGKIVDGVLERELAKFQALKGITITPSEDVKGFLARKAFERSLDEGARGAPRAVNEYIVTPAIDTLSRLEDDTGDVPRSVAIEMAGLRATRVVVLGPDDRPNTTTGDALATFDPARLAQGRR